MMMVASCADLRIIGQRSGQIAKGRKPQPEQNTANMVVSTSGDGTGGYGNLPYVLLVFQYTTWWLDFGVNIHMCSDASLFSSY
jgi:hypothetical protein